jgi:hypothetical protein
VTQPELPADLLQREQEFHDQWASTIVVDGINVADYFEACTAPENRFILRQLGNVSGKSLLDFGCGNRLFAGDGRGGAEVGRGEWRED